MVIIAISRCLSWGFLESNRCYGGQFHFKGYLHGRHISSMQLYMNDPPNTVLVGEDYLFRMTIMRVSEKGVLLGRIETIRPVDD